jgi:hypothetical protein
MTTFDELTAWDGKGNVKRTDSGVVSGRRIPEEQKALLVDVGIPILDWARGHGPACSWLL